MAFRRAALLHLATQCAQVIGSDFVELAILEDRKDVPVDDVFAHRLGAVGHTGTRQPLLGYVAEGLGGAVSRRLSRCFSSAGDLP